MGKLNVDGTEIQVLQIEEDDYISLTDMVRKIDNGPALIEKWLRNKNTIDFANNLYAAVLDFNVGEEITDAQAEFSRKYVDIPWGKNSEWQILTWLSVLLMEAVAISGGRLDFEEYEEYEQDVDFMEMEEMLNMLADVFIDLTYTPLQSNKAVDVMNAQEQVYQKPLFRQFIERIQNGLKAALSAAPKQYPALREEYHQYAILPEEYAAKLLGCL